MPTSRVAPFSLVACAAAAVVAAAALAGWTPAPPLAAQPTASWDDGFFLTGLDGPVHALLRLPNGDLLVGGAFDTAGPVPARGLARWDGSRWHDVGGGVGGEVWALTPDATGGVVVGGSFSSVGGIAADNVALWNGLFWSALGAGTNDRVEALVADGSGSVFVGGAFTQAGGAPAARVARWDGASWTALGSGLDGTVHALALVAGNLYVGGAFGTAGGASAWHVARWDGGAWHAMGSGTNDEVLALLRDGTGILAAGSFTAAGGQPSTGYIARWNGTTWSAVGGVQSGIADSVRALARDAAGRLVAAGDFNRGDPAGARSVARWDGGAWSTIGDGVGGAVRALAAGEGDELAAGGEFTTAGIAAVNYVSLWSDSAWGAIGDGGSGLCDRDDPGRTSAEVTAITVKPNGDLVAAGTFTAAGDVIVDRIAVWDGATWSRIPGTMDAGAALNALAADGSGNVYLGGAFSVFGGASASNVARWNGSGWSALGAGTNNTVTSLDVDEDGLLYAAGSFGSAGGVSAANVARWDGSTWSPLGSGWPGARFVAVGGDHAYACCSLRIDGFGVGYAVGRWDGSSWSLLGNAFDRPVTALWVAPDGTPYVGGQFTRSGTTPLEHIALWDGSGWSALGTGVNNQVVDIVSSADGDVYAAGTFTAAGGNAASRIARYDGGSWDALGSGLGGDPRALALAADGSLFVAGRFVTAGGIPSSRIARYGAPAALPTATVAPSPTTTTAAPTPSAPASPVAGSTATSTQTIPASTASTTPTPSRTPTASATATASPTPSLTPTSGPTPTASTTPTPSDTPTASDTPTSTSTATQTRTPSVTPSVTPTTSPTPTVTPYPDADDRWDGAIGAPGIDGLVEAVAADGRGNVYVGGQIQSAGGVAASNVAWWDGQRWRSPSGGTDGPVRALAVGPGGRLYAGGSFTFAGGLPIRNIAMWDGFAWQSVGGGLSDAVSAFTIDASGRLVAAGLFSSAGDVDANHIAAWDGQDWEAFGPGLDGDVTAVAAGRSGRVAAVTVSESPGGGVEYRVSLWESGLWRDIRVSTFRIGAVAIGPDGQVYAGGTAAGGVARWNGSTWSPTGIGLNQAVNALALDPYGYLYAAGAFTTSGATAVNRVARWDGASWSPLGRGLSGTGSALAIDARGLYVGGPFSTAGGKVSNRVGWYRSPEALDPATPGPTPEGPCYQLTLLPADGGTVRASTAGNCGGGYVEGTVVTLRAEPAAGYRWLRWEGDAAGASVVTNVVMDGDRSVGASFASGSSGGPAVVLVHGWGGQPGGTERRCPADGRPIRIDEALLDTGTLPEGEIEGLARHLLADGQVVWLASYDAGPSATVTIPTAADCVREQLAWLRGAGFDPLSVLAHDLGGWVVRAYLESERFARDRADGRVPSVQLLATLGTAHGAPDAARLGCAVADEPTAALPGLCIAPIGEVETLNARVFAQRAPGTRYALVGGTLAPAPSWSLPLHSLDAAHDGLVGLGAAVGRSVDRAWPAFWLADARPLVGGGPDAPLERWAATAAHESRAAWLDPARLWQPSYFEATPGDPSAPPAYGCVRRLLGLSDTGCQAFGDAPAPATPQSATMLSAGHVDPGGSLDIPLRLDGTGRAQIAAAWVTGTMGVTLLDPLGGVLDPARAAASGTLDYVGPETHAESALGAMYAFTTTVPGAYTASLTAIDLPPGGSDVVLAATMSSRRTLHVRTDRRVVAGARTVVTAGLGSGAAGVSGGDVTMHLTVPGVGVVSTTAVDRGGGVYSTVLDVPVGHDRLPLQVVAQGDDDGTPFTRTAVEMLYAVTDRVAPTGAYTTEAIDDDGDGLFDGLQVTVGVTATTAGRFLVAADLVDDQGRFVGHTVARATLLPGAQDVVLRFDGDQIRASGHDGRYRIADLTIVAADGSLDPVHLGGAGSLSTSSYAATSFASRCFVVDAVVDPPGAGRIAAAPDGNCNGGLQYATGTVVTLDAWENPGYAFARWSGDVSGSDASTVVTASGDRRVVAHFDVLATATPSPSATPSATATATVTPLPSPTSWASPTATTSAPTTAPVPTSTATPLQTPPTATAKPGGPRSIHLPILYKRKGM